MFRRIVAKQKNAHLTEYSFEVKFQKNQFVNWFAEQYEKQDGRCYYCGTRQDDINRLIKEGVLTSKRFKTRGRNLELERLDSGCNAYSPQNCTLVCYFCNNDKSDVVSSQHYIQFFAGSKKQYMQFLLNSLSSSNEK